MMGCGKTTVGRLLSDHLGRELIDTDAFIEAREGRSVSDIFAAHGEPYFRDLELAACRELSRTSGRIVACGGGLPLRPDCIGALKGSGPVFWLDRDPSETYDGLDTSGRPLAQAGKAAFLDRYRDRAPIYRQWADYVITRAPTPEAAAAAITAILQSEETDL